MSVTTTIQSRLVAGLACLVFLSGGSTGQAAEDSGWSNQALIYLLGPTLDGTSGIGPFDT